MKKKLLAVVLLFLVCVDAPAASAPAGTPGSFELRFPHLKLGVNERVVSIEVDMNAAETTSISNVPAGWFVALDNEPSGQASIKANVRVGTAALEPDGLEKIRIVIAKHEFEGLKFGVSATLSVTADYKTERAIHFSSKDLLSTSIR